MRLLIAGGGTGGHLYPGIALAEEVMRRPGGEVLFVGTARGLESKLVPAAGFPLELLEVSGLNRVGVGRFLKGVLRLPKAFFASRAILRRFQPDLVIGVGGYASGPLVLTAALLGFPTAIQEQNSHPGFTNRVLGHFVRRVFIAFPNAAHFFAPRKTVLLGNPVRRRFLDAPAVAAGGQGPRMPDGGLAATVVAGSSPSDAGGSVPPMVLIVGGSQGARAVNDLVLGAAAILKGEGRLPRLVHQTGPNDEARVRATYEELGLTDRVDVRAFIDDMPATLAQAALVIGRAGALTLAELAMLGRPAILIPLPSAADDHQRHNAASFAAVGAAAVAEQHTTTPQSLARLVVTLCDDAPAREAMSRAMSSLARPAAASDIVDELERVSERPSSPGASATATAMGTEARR